MRLRQALAVAAIAVLVGACAPSDSTSKEKSSPKPSVTDAAATTFFEHLGSEQPDRLETALDMSADDSIAHAYATHRLALANAAADDGTPTDGGSVKRKGSGYRYCAVPDDPTSCYVWADIQARDGKIASFTVDGEELGSRLSVGSGTPVKAGKVGTVDLLTAYHSVTGDSVFVTMLVRSADLDISVGHLSATYRSPSGRQTEASDAIGPSDLGANSNGHVVAIFNGAEPGGEVKFDLDSADYEHSATVKLKTR
jgi:hypothetical protein